jgi:hypothetical protein
MAKKPAAKKPATKKPGTSSNGRYGDILYQVKDQVAWVTINRRPNSDTQNAAVVFVRCQSKKRSTIACYPQLKAARSAIWRRWLADHFRVVVSEVRTQ